MAIDTGDKVTRKYANFRGVDFRGEDCSLNRSPDALNVWRNYKKLSSIETRPGLEHIFTYNKGIKAMKWHRGKLYFVGGDGFLHALCVDGMLDWELIYVGYDAILFDFDGDLYVKGSSNYLNITTGKSLADGAYIPTTSIGRKPSGGGKIHEDVNMLSPYRINTFCGDYYNPKDPNAPLDGSYSSELHLDAENIDADYPVEITINDITFLVGDEVPKELKEYFTIVEVNHERGIIDFYSGGNGDIGGGRLPAPKTDGQDNISVKFKKANAEYVNKIMRCTIAQEFDNRIFFSGNPDYPNVMWHSSLHNPFYISDLDYYEDGIDAAPIRSLVAGNNALWVFRDAETNNSVFYHVPTLDSDYGKVYPSSHSSISLGCAGRAINFNDDIVFFSRRGMESASTDITTEQFATHKSSLVDRKMITHPKYKDMILAEWEGYLLVFMGNDVFLADSRAMLTNENHTEYEWYHWNFGRYSVNCTTVYNGVLYIGMVGDTVDGIPEGHIYTLTRDTINGDEHSGYTPGGDKWQEQAYIDSYWTTPKDKFGAANKLKTTNKKGCVVEASGDVDIYAKVEDTDFELIGTNKDVDDYFVSRIKRKKFKDIQLKFQSQTGFCLESATLECFVGGYIKR